MAKTTTVNKYKTFKKFDPRTGKMRRVKVKVGTQTTNTAKGAGTPNLTANQLKSQQIAADKAAKMAKIAGNQVNVANIANQIGMSVRSLAGSSNGQSLPPKTDVNDSLASGGLQNGSTNRDEDDDLVS